MNEFEALQRLYAENPLIETIAGWFRNEVADGQLLEQRKLKTGDFEAYVFLYNILKSRIDDPTEEANGGTNIHTKDLFYEYALKILPVLEQLKQ